MKKLKKQHRKENTQNKGGADKNRKHDLVRGHSRNKLTMSVKTKVVLKIALFLFFLAIFAGHCQGVWRPKGEFLAGSFILTQKSLDEAPYRYAGVLRKALDKAEMKDPPSKSDEENCSVRYRISPSGNFKFLQFY